MIITEETRPICEKCKERPAITIVGKTFLCGKCLQEFLEKMEEAKRRLMFEE